jgi:phenylalanyl-tRNA synthetase beta chain
LLAGVRLFDVYQGEQVGPGKKSLAYGLTYQADDRTLTDKEVAKLQARIVRSLEEKLGARLRA